MEYLVLYYLNHSHQKRKNSLEARAEPTVFSFLFEFRKLLEPSPPKPAWNISINSAKNFNSLEPKDYLHALSQI